MAQGGYPRLSKHEIRQIAQHHTNRFEQVVGSQTIAAEGFAFSLFYEQYAKPLLGVRLIDGVDIDQPDDGSEVLGRYIPSLDLIQISTIVGPGSADPRRAFTLWHEMGHAILHSYFKDRRLLGRETQSPRSTTSDHAAGRCNGDAEWQANVIAGMLGAPARWLRFAVYTALNCDKSIIFTSPTTYTIGRDHCSRVWCDSVDELAEAVARRIALRFGGLSVQSIAIQLKEERFVCSADTLCRRSPARTSLRQFRGGGVFSRSFQREFGET